MPLARKEIKAIPDFGNLTFDLLLAITYALSPQMGHASPF
jgi:hypothetical protein